jgi:hypothetical protein
MLLTISTDQDIYDTSLISLRFAEIKVFLQLPITLVTQKEILLQVHPPISCPYPGLGQQIVLGRVLITFTITVLYIYYCYHIIEVTFLCRSNRDIILLHGPALPFQPLYLPSNLPQLEHLCSVTLNRVMQNGMGAQGKHLKQKTYFNIWPSQETMLTSRDTCLYRVPMRECLGWF